MERGESLRRVFEIFKPGMDPGQARKLRAAQGWTYDFIPPPTSTPTPSPA